MLKWIAIASLVLLVGARPAAADTITNTFVGTVLSADNSGVANDSGGYFGGGNLFGLPFTLTTTLDSTLYYTSDDPANPSFITGGTYYSGSSGNNPISAALTINGDTYTMNDSSDAQYFDPGLGNGTIEAFLQTFNYDPGLQLQTQSIGLDLTTNVPASQFLLTSLPTMLLSNNDFVQNSSYFGDASGESLQLNVDAVNPVPEPGTMALVGTGLACMVGRRFRARRNRRHSSGQ